MHIDKVPVASVFDAERFFLFSSRNLLTGSAASALLYEKSEQEKKKVLNSTF